MKNETPEQPSLFPEDGEPAAQTPAPPPDTGIGPDAAPAEPDAMRPDDPAEPPPPPPPPHPPADGHKDSVAGDPLRSMMDSNFLQYASYVICDRAIPNLEDGLKPVQRRILHSLFETDDGRFTKVANIVGHCMQYHPHGDASIGDALVTLVNRGYLIEGQGNFGNLFTGDSAAASRYIECRLTELARNEIFNKDLTRWVPSYDGRRKEPVTLPAKLPLLLMLGAEGIAVGLATRLLPHNFPELLEAQIAILEKKPFKILPDFPQGGLADFTEFDKGLGRIRLRARIVPREGQKLSIVELPYGTTTETLTNTIEEAARAGKVPVKTIDDFTSDKVEIELTLHPEASVTKAIESLYAFTACETTISAHPVVIYKNRPADMDTHQILEANTAQLLRILKAELLLRKRQLLEELHSKTLVQLFVEHRIYKLIEDCPTYPAVQKAVLDGLAPFRDRLRRDITLQDVELLLSIKIRRISLFDSRKNEKELEGILAELQAVEKSLAEPVKHAIRYLKDLLKKYAARYPRKTQIASFGNIELRTLTAKELTLYHDREKGYLGSQVEGQAILECSSYDKIVVVWQDGRYKLMTPPEKLFVDSTLLYCSKYDREKVMTLVYTQDEFTFIKRFTFGGMILNKEYLCTLEGAKILLLEEGTPEVLYLRYNPAKGQRIHQQSFRPEQVPVKSVKSRGNQLTSKSVARITSRKPSWWDESSAVSGGPLLL